MRARLIATFVPLLLLTTACGLMPPDDSDPPPPVRAEPAPAPGTIAPTPSPIQAEPPQPAEPADEEPPPPPSPGPLPAVQVRLGRVTVEGAIAPEVVRRVVRRHQSEVADCYARGLAGAPALEGRVVLSCTIQSGGASRSCAIDETTLGRPTVEHCITEAGARWTFPGLDDGDAATFHSPFVLSPR